MIYNILNLGRNALKGMQDDLDNTAHNIANANTTGYKKKNTSFQELVNNRSLPNEVILSENIGELNVNAGIKNGVHTVNHKQGSIYPTQAPYHMALDGPGFFGVRNEGNDLILTRNGAFHRDEDGRICNESGYELDVEILVPENQWGSGEVTIASDGEISSMEAGVKRVLGQVILYSPENRGELLPIDETSFYLGEGVLNNSIDSPYLFGNLVQGYLENSNVDMAESMVDMITTQRAYSMNARAVQTVDEVMTMINGLKR